MHLRAPRIFPRLFLTSWQLVTTPHLVFNDNKSLRRRPHFPTMGSSAKKKKEKKKDFQVSRSALPHHIYDSQG